ncbi:MAG: adenylate/guanylate cyclase domain-containing protein [Saprospiraceae bacterium]
MIVYPKNLGIGLFLLFCLFVKNIKAQPNLDSLWTVWQDETRDDSIQLAALREFIWTGYLQRNIDSAQYFIELQHTFAEKNNQHWGIADALLNRGIIYLFKGDPKIALTYFEEGLEMSIAHTSVPTQLEALVNIGVAHASLGEPNKAISTNEQGLEIARKYGILSSQVKFLINNGIQYNDLGDYPKALDYYFQALKIEEQQNLPERINLYINIGNIYHSQGDVHKALEYFNNALKLAEKNNNLVAMGIVDANLGVLHLEMGDTTQAINLFTISKEVSEKLGNKNGMANGHLNIGWIYQSQGNYSKALYHYTQELKLSEEIGNQSMISNAYLHIGHLYKDKGNHTKAVDFCQKGFEIASSIGALSYARNACECLYFSYKRHGNSAKALEYFEHMMTLQDSMFNESNTKKLTQMEMRYEFDKQVAATQAEQEKKDAVASQELKRQTLVRNGFMGGFGLVLLFAGVFFVQRNKIGKEKQRSDALLLNILPEKVAEELKVKGHSEAQLIDHATVLFTDFKGFTSLSEKMTPSELVKDLHECFSLFDKICARHGVEKIKTIGDAYMAAGGLPSPNTTHALDVVNAAFEIAEIIEKGKVKKIEKGLPYFEIRIGVHTGPVVAGIVGVKKFQYDIWGDTVNTASRMESSGEAGKVNISETTFELVKDNFTCIHRGKVQAKGKGEVNMYFVEGRS